MTKKNSVIVDYTFSKFIRNFVQVNTADFNDTESIVCQKV